MICFSLFFILNITFYFLLLINLFNLLNCYFLYLWFKFNSNIFKLFISLNLYMINFNHLFHSIIYRMFITIIETFIILHSIISIKILIIIIIFQSILI